MATNVSEIPRAHWPAYLDHFSRTHRAWLVTIETSAPPADRSEAAAHPLRSITPFVHNDRVAHIDIRFQDDAQGHEPRRIQAPAAVRVDETTDGIAQGLEIVDGHGRSTWLRFRAAPRPEMLDGIAPGGLSS